VIFLRLDDPVVVEATPRMSRVDAIGVDVKKVYSPTTTEVVESTVAMFIYLVVYLFIFKMILYCLSC
jgi:hypothetical protein